MPGPSNFCPDAPDYAPRFVSFTYDKLVYLLQTRIDAVKDYVSSICLSRVRSLMLHRVYMDLYLVRHALIVSCFVVIILATATRFPESSVRRPAEMWPRRMLQPPLILVDVKHAAHKGAQEL